MIAKLEGIIEDLFDTFMILMVDGIGFKVEGNFGQYKSGDKVKLYIYHHIREQEERLIGFLDKDEYTLFQVLITVSGVGPKVAKTLIDAIGVSDIIGAINNEDPNILKAPGVGRKTAQRVIVDLKGKIDESQYLNINTANIHNKSIHPIVENAVEALISLGFNRAVITKVIENINLDDYNDEGKLVKEILSKLK